MAAATLLALPLGGCSGPGPIIDKRTGQPMMAGPWENRNVGLTTYRVTVFGKYRLTHAGLQGINIKPCYAGAPQDDVQLVIHEEQVHDTPPGMDQRKMSWKEIQKYPRVGIGVFVPAYTYYSEKWGEQRTVSLKGEIDGTRWHGALTLPDGTKKKITRMDFDELCGDPMAGGSIGLGIRNASSESIEQYVADATEHWADPDRPNRPHRFLIPPQRTRQGDNEWTYFRGYGPGVFSDVQEEWMLPIGSSGYYLWLRFNYIEKTQEANIPDYLRARQLFDGILDSVNVEKLGGADRAAGSP